MKAILAVIFIAVFISGCAVGIPCLNNKNMRVKEYKTATVESKDKLAEDLRMGKIGLGDSLDKIRVVYGDADDIFVSGCTVRLIYRIDSDKNVTLWFEAGERLSMWRI